MRNKILSGVFFFVCFLKLTAQTYIPQGSGVKLIEIEGCKKKIGGLPCDSCFILTGGIQGRMSRCFHISEIRAMIDTTYAQDSVILLNNATGTYSLKNEYGTYYEFGYKLDQSGDTLFLTDLDGTRTDSVVIASGTDCACCDSLLFFDSDTAAHNYLWINKGDYYLTSEDNVYGDPWGCLRQILEDVGFIIADASTAYAVAGAIIALNENVGFSGRAPRCKFLAPDNVLVYYTDDTEANADLDYGDYYLLDYDNEYGQPKGRIKKIVEP